MGGRTDRELARELKAGSRTAAAEVFERYHRGVWKVAFALSGRRALADEAAQDTFVRMIERIDQYDADKPLRPWLNGIAAHRALDLLRRERRLEPAGLGDESGVEWEPQPEAGAFLARLAALASDQRAVVVLRYGLDMRPEEIAGALEIPVGTVHSRLARALEQLREEAGSRADAG